MRLICCGVNDGLLNELNTYYSSFCKPVYINQNEDLSSVLEQHHYECQVLVLDYDAECETSFQLIAKVKKMEIPVIVLLDDYQQDTRARLLLMGVSMTLKKPSTAIEILYSAKAICNQYKPAIIYDNNFSIDLIDRKVWYKSNQINISLQLFDILVYFVKHSDSIITRCEILEALHPEKECKERSIDTLIRKLRNATNSDIIETCRGVGYYYNSK